MEPPTTTPRPATRYTDLRRGGAVAVLAIAAGAAAWCVAPASTAKFAPGPIGGARPDLDLYHSIVSRVRAGEGYYDAAAAELRAGYYGTRSLFGWRTPLYAWFLGRVLPSPAWGRPILGAVALSAVGLAFAAIARDGGPWLAAWGAVLVFFALSGCFVGGLSLLTECWAGPLIAVSLLARGLGRWRVSVAAGLLALFIRELAAPYVVIGLVLALRARRRGEAAAWAAGLVAYAGYYGLHAARVFARITDADPAYPTGWIQFGGLRFVLATVSMNGFLLALPGWVGGIYLVLALLGLHGWRGDLGRRSELVAGAYLLLFAVAGRPANAYWGLIVAPILALGVAWSPLAVRDLIGAALRPPSPAGGVPASAI